MPTPLCLTVGVPTCHECDRSENMLSTLQEQVIKLQALMEKINTVVKKHFLSLQNDLYQDLKMLLLCFTNMWQPTYMSPKSDGE